MNKFTITLLILIIVVIIAGIGVVLVDRETSPPEPTYQPEVVTNDENVNGWEIYNGHSAYNEEDKFQISFPNDWDFRHNIEGKWQLKKNVIYSTDYGPQECFLVLGAGGHGLSGVETIEEEEIEVNGRVGRKVLRTSNGEIQGQVSFGDDSAPIIFEFFTGETSLDNKCLNDIDDIVETFTKIN